MLFLTSGLNVICGDRFRASTTFQAPCRARYCFDCLKDLVPTCVGDESLFPLRCCQQFLPVSRVLDLVPSGLRTRFEAKSREFSTLANDRLYCSNSTCSRYLGSAQNFTSRGNHPASCFHCYRLTCALCKEPFHPDENCAENTALVQLKAIAAEQHRQTCPRCDRIIEFHHGCYHITCSCRMEFCYLCAVPWTNWGCP
ncbi:hypothetical protein GYMLUDRAFT_1026392 [Collybiopsis luxurians FD-317 M1]|uniref:RBR-type E3 ubiquitin transferase n=1 Tax=Collybiopsis luxurians FD-317 M1 TaxID=944289 RepID=A0A0D0BV21_9AGAR|nr:hypothetical protein GYMLUDRAFT_1026392 [Collybiopsis luxurians FD-317 M1]